MSQLLDSTHFDIFDVNVDDLITENNTSEDFYTAKQQRLLTETLYSSWEGPPAR